jgi:hypothetical protein
MCLNLFDVVRGHYREPDRRLLAFDDSPSVIAYLEYAGAVSGHIKGYLIRNIDKTVIFYNPFNRFLLRAVLVTGYNLRRFAQQQVCKQQCQPLMPVEDPSQVLPAGPHGAALSSLYIPAHVCPRIAAYFEHIFPTAPFRSAAARVCLVLKMINL